MKILKNDYILSGLTKFLTLLLGVLSSALITRYMGPSIKGQFGLITSWLNVLGLILNLGLYQAYVYYRRHNLKHKNFIKSVFVNIFIIQFLILLLINCLIISFSSIPNDYIYILALTPIMVLAIQFKQIILAEDVKRRLLIDNVYSILYLLLSIILFLFFKSKIEYIIIITFLVNSVAVLQSFRFLKFSRVRISLSFFWLKKAVSFGFLPMLTGLLLTLNYNVNVFLLKEYVSYEQLGFYITGVSLANYIWIIPDVFKDVLYNRTAESDSIKTVILSIKLSLLFVVVALVLIVVLGDYLLLILYGKEFSASYHVTVVLLLGAPAMVFYKLIGTLFIAQGKIKFNFVILLLSLITNVSINYFSIPKYGIIGAALASAISYSFCGIPFVYYFMKEYKLSFRDVFILSFTDMKNIIRNENIN